MTDKRWLLTLAIIYAAAVVAHIAWPVGLACAALFFVFYLIAD